jgi:hypothetical protein
MVGTSPTMTAGGLEFPALHFASAENDGVEKGRRSRGALCFSRLSRI